jgi:amino acid permease
MLRKLPLYSAILLRTGYQTGKRRITLCNFIFKNSCVVAGTGMLQIPFSLSQMGWSGILVLFLLAAVNSYTSILLIKCLKEEKASFPELGRKLFGRLGYYIVSFFYGTAMGGSVCLYLILAGMNLESLIGIFSQSEWMTILAGMLLFPLILVKTLKEVGLVSLFGMVTSVLVVFIVAVTSTLDYENYKDRVSHKLFDIHAFGPVLGTLCFSYGGNYVYPEIYRDMNEKSKFSRVLIMSISVITFLYLIGGVAGYLTYGDLAISPILLNLPIGTFYVTKATED